MKEFDWQGLMDAAEEAGGFELIPEGNYNAEVTQADVTETSNGDLMIKFTHRITDGPYVGRLLFNNLSAVPPKGEKKGNLRMFFRDMLTLGADKTDFDKGTDPQVIADKLVGKRARFEVGRREWGGQEYEDVKKIQPLRGDGDTPKTSSAPPVSPAQSERSTDSAETVPPPPPF